MCKEIAEQTVLYKDNEIRLTVTIGLSFYSDQMDIEEMIKQANKNLYKEKKNGRNCVVC